MKRQTRAAQLRALMREKPHIYFPAVYDALSASMAEKAGFEAVLVSGSSISNERLGITESIEKHLQICYMLQTSLSSPM